MKLLNINIKSIVFLRNELPILNTNSRSKTTDALILIDDNKYIHIELNTESDTKHIRVRNFTFFTEIYDRKTLRGKKYKIDDNFIHIDLSYNLRGKEVENSYYVMDINNKRYVENFKIVEYNMDNIKKFWYSKDIENIYKYLHLVILDLNSDELEYVLKNLDLSEGDELFVKTYYEKTKDLNDKEYFKNSISAEEDAWRWDNTMKSIGYEKGIEDGIQEKNKSVVKKMKELNISSEQISIVTGLSIEEIEKI